MEVPTVRKLAFLMLIFALTANPCFAKNPDRGPAGLDELTKEKGQFKKTLINQDTDFSKYTKLYPTRVRLEIRGPGSASSGTGKLTGRASRDSSIPDGESLAQFAEIINETLVEELGRSESFQIVQEIGPGTLILRPAITELVCEISSEPVDEGKKPKPFSAQGTITFDLIDAETGAILVRVSERRKSGKDEGSAPPEDLDVRWGKVCTWAEAAAVDLRQELERVQSEDGGAKTGTGA